MNKYQRMILFTTATILIAMLLFPPFASQMLQGVAVNAGYSFILAPPSYEVGRDSYKSQVNLNLLGLQFLMVITAGGILCLALKSR